MTAYAYDAVGNVSTITVTRGTATLRQTTNTFDPEMHWLTSVVNEDGSDIVLSQFTYTRRDDGQIMQVDESVKQPDGSTVTTTALYDYDALNRLTREDVDTSTTGADYVKEYTLDKVGNRVKLIETDEDQAPLETDSSYDERDRLLTETTDGATISYGYNTNGSLIIRQGGGEDASYDWDLLGHLIGATVTKDGTTTETSYRYTPNGIRSSVSENGVTTDYLIDALSPSGYAQVIEERASGLLQVGYIYGLGLDPVSQWRRDQGTGLYLADGHSGVRQVIDVATMSVLLAQRFDAFGNTVAKTGSFVTPIGYRGGRLDAVTGWYDDRARPYDPRTGRFPAIDPAAGTYGDQLQLMRYGYAGANPIKHSDPTGMFLGLGASL
jgi:RHS repeat-associated protein